MTKYWFFSSNGLEAAQPLVRFMQPGLAPVSITTVSLAYLIWVIWSLPLWSNGSSLTDEKPVPVTHTAPVSDTPPDYLQIADWHLWGQPASVTHDSTLPVSNTSLQLKLLGTFVLADSNSYAVIQSSDGGQQKFRVGEKLPEGATLETVEPTRVLLRHNQSLEALAFDPNPVTLSKID